MFISKPSSSVIMLIFLTTLILLSTVAVAGEHNPAVNASQGLTLAGPGLAIHGYDTVAFFTAQAAELGSAEFSAVHEGATYRFANADNLKTFKKNPERYAPQFGGFCAFGVSVGAKFDGDPNLWRVVEGKLYFNLNKGIQSEWLKDVSGNIEKAGKNWPVIKDAAASSLK